MLDGDFEEGINISLYHKIAKVSKPTASRHLATLVELGCLVKTGAGGRSTRYVLGEYFSLGLTHFYPKVSSCNYLLISHSWYFAQLILI